MDLMIDLETWGTRPGDAIRSVGAVLFDRKTGAFGDTFYVNIDDASNDAEGFTREDSTVKWWSEQSAEAVAALAADPTPVRSALAMLAFWIDTSDFADIWCQGASFDFPILRAAFAKCDIEQPWKFWTEKDSRTVLQLGNRKPQRTFGEHHNALADAKAQAVAVAAALRTGIKL